MSNFKFVSRTTVEQTPIRSRNRGIIRVDIMMKFAAIFAVAFQSADGARDGLRDGKAIESEYDGGVDVSQDSAFVQGCSAAQHQNCTDDAAMNEMWINYCLPYYTNTDFDFQYKEYAAAVYANPGYLVCSNICGYQFYGFVN